MVVQVAPEHAVVLPRPVGKSVGRRLQQDLRRVDRAGGDDDRAAADPVGRAGLHVADEHRLDALARRPTIRAA